MHSQRQVTVEIFDFAGFDVISEKLRIDLMLVLPAERTLEVGVFDQGHLSGAISADRLVVD